ncbi:MAG: UDP-N-acetylmuramate dehydrogenase [Bacteroidales bacterium]|nr:UDP-N-acetylmuramate dehydrogenase [Bacteroidales bacterium]
MDIQQDISLKSWHTFATEARAKYFVRIHNAEDIPMLLKDNRFASHRHNLWLGGGSNVLFTGDFDGTVVQLGMKGVEVEAESSEYIWLRAEGGENWDDLVKHTLLQGWGGLENLSMIPGNVGTSPVQNIGAYGRELKDVFDHLIAYDLVEHKIVRFNKADCQFGYRDSIFKRKYKNRMIILSVVFRLMKKPVIEISYGGLKREIEKMGIADPGIKDVSQAVRKIRMEKLPHPDELGNAGSFFKNPVVDAGTHQNLKSRFPEMVTFPIEDYQFKIAAGWMIDYLGWRGYREGDAGVHDKQALVLVNYGNARGMDIYQLSKKIQASVKEEFGIELQPEVNIY